MVPIEEIVLYWILGCLFLILLLVSLIVTLAIFWQTNSSLTFQKTALICLCIQCALRTWTGFASPFYYDTSYGYPTWLFVIHGQAPAILFFSIYSFLIVFAAQTYFHHTGGFVENVGKSGGSPLALRVTSWTLIVLNALSYFIFILFFCFLLLEPDDWVVSTYISRIWKGELGAGYITGAILHVTFGFLLFRAKRNVPMTPSLRKSGHQTLFLSLVCAVAFLIKGIFYFATWGADPHYVTAFLLLFLGEFLPLTKSKGTAVRPPSPTHDIVAGRSPPTRPTTASLADVAP
ncbi:hypothetical protein PAPYR_8429 [Paratrimastix pyriformis]|uniref:THH1/TOM1/TOM3 domain-containing protein n=1 Tax=Paratrimastix pyriformis TaxID=342808 RepID=A0ABQ8UAQ6_9EUKA|nr:hypothetical protein PAPYR_8429 [Paratrimastix pyriformis]